MTDFSITLTAEDEVLPAISQKHRAPGLYAVLVDGQRDVDSHQCKIAAIRGGDSVVSRAAHEIIVKSIGNPHKEGLSRRGSPAADAELGRDDARAGDAEREQLTGLVEAK